MQFVTGPAVLHGTGGAFEERRAAVLAEWGAEAAEDRDEYAAENVFWAPPEARWSPVEPSPVRAVVTVRSAAGGPLPGADVVLTLDPPDGIELAGLA